MIFFPTECTPILRVEVVILHFGARGQKGAVCFECFSFSGGGLMTSYSGEFGEILCGFPRVLWQEITPTLIFSFSNNMSEANASYCGVKRNNASYLRKQMLQPSSLCYAVPSLKRRFMKHGFAVWSAAYAAWSGTACHEAKPFQDSCFFYPKFVQKMGCKLLFLHLFFTREGSNFFYANRNNCTTTPIRLFT